MVFRGFLGGFRWLLIRGVYRGLGLAVSCKQLETSEFEEWEILGGLEVWAWNVGVVGVQGIYWSRHAKPILHTVWGLGAKNPPKTLWVLISRVISQL